MEIAGEARPLAQDGSVGERRTKPELLKLAPDARRDDVSEVEETGGEGSRREDEDPPAYVAALERRAGEGGAGQEYRKIAVDDGSRHRFAGKRKKHATGIGAVSVERRVRELRCE